MLMRRNLTTLATRLACYVPAVYQADKRGLRTASKFVLTAERSAQVAILAPQTGMKVFACGVLLSWCAWLRGHHQEMALKQLLFFSSCTCQAQAARCTQPLQPLAPFSCQVAACLAWYSHFAGGCFAGKVDVLAFANFSRALQGTTAKSGEDSTVVDYSCQALSQSKDARDKVLARLGRLYLQCRVHMPALFWCPAPQCKLQVAVAASDASAALYTYMYTISPLLTPGAAHVA